MVSQSAPAEDADEPEGDDEDADDVPPDSSDEQAATSGTMLAPASSRIMRRRASTGRS
jgi:hypothetical protein